MKPRKFESPLCRQPPDSYAISLYRCYRIFVAPRGALILIVDLMFNMYQNDRLFMLFHLAVSEFFMWVLHCKYLDLKYSPSKTRSWYVCTIIWISIIQRSTTTDYGSLRDRVISLDQGGYWIV